MGPYRTILDLCSPQACLARFHLCAVLVLRCSRPSLGAYTSASESRSSPFSSVPPPQFLS
ncbi:hypothetical protein HDV57DRAFT_492192 [Trichoderma longibrachiatum]